MNRAMVSGSRRSGRSRWGARRIVRLLYRAIVIALLLVAVLVLAYRFIPPVSTLMLARWLTLETVARDFVYLSAISPALARAVVSSEDSRFCHHHGVDWGALREVIAEAEEDGPARGASTIAMQTARNTFLWPGRSYIRKGLEIPLALTIDAVWSKRRVMEVYLNVAEWGDGVFGAEAAARRHFRKSARELSHREAALLAAVLPNPIRRNAGKPSTFVARRASRIVARMALADVSCLR